MKVLVALCANLMQLTPKTCLNGDFLLQYKRQWLLRSLPVETKMIYILTKALLKATVLQEPLLTTYHLKTLFLWYLESNPDNDSNHNIDDNVKLFLKFVLKHIKDHEVKNYFIPANNYDQPCLQRGYEKYGETDRRNSNQLLGFTQVYQNSLSLSILDKQDCW